MNTKLPASPSARKSGRWMYVGSGLFLVAVASLWFFTKLGSYVDRNSEVVVFADLQELTRRIESFRERHGRVPLNGEGLAVLPFVRVLSRLPVAGSIPKDPWGREYAYVQPGYHSQNYDLYSLGMDGRPGTADDIGNWDLPETAQP